MLKLQLLTCVLNQNHFMFCLHDKTANVRVCDTAIVAKVLANRLSALAEYFSDVSFTVLY